MICPEEDDIGRAVVYTGNRYPGGKLEEGVSLRHSMTIACSSATAPTSTAREHHALIWNGCGRTPARAEAIRRLVEIGLKAEEMSDQI